MHPSENTAVSARWVANRIANAVKKSPDITPDRLVKTRDGLESWIPGAIRRASTALNPSKAGYPGRSQAVGLLNKYVGKADNGELPKMVSNIGGFPLNPLNRLVPHYRPASKKLQPGGSWPIALHEYGHAMDHRVRPDDYSPGSFRTYPAEMMANRQASKALKVLQDEGLPVPSTQELYRQLKPAIETYRINELSRVFSPMVGRNKLQTYSPVHRAQRALWDRFIEPARTFESGGNTLDLMDDWSKQVRPNLSTKNRKVPILNDLRVGWRVG